MFIYMGHAGTPLLPVLLLLVWQMESWKSRTTRFPVLHAMSVVKWNLIAAWWGSFKASLALRIRILSFTNMELLSCPAVCPLECFSVHSAQFFLLPHIHTEGIYGIYGRVYGTWCMVYGIWYMAQSRVQLNTLSTCTTSTGHKLLIIQFRAKLCEARRHLTNANATPRLASPGLASPHPSPAYTSLRLHWPGN